MGKQVHILTKDGLFEHLLSTDLEIINELVEWANMKGIEGHLVHDITAEIFYEGKYKIKFNCMVEENEDL